MSPRGAAVLASLAASLLVVPAAARAGGAPAGAADAADDDDDNADLVGLDDGDGDGGAGDDEPRLITAADRAADPDEPGEPRFKDHRHQFGIGLQIPVGLRVIKPYEDEYCGQRDTNEGSGNAKVCVGRVPATLDFEIAYGLKPNLELLFELRLGLERDFGPTYATTDNGPRLFQWSPGVKFYFSDAGVSKLFSTVQLAFDNTGYDKPAGTSRGMDFIVRNVNGLQLDLHPSYGLYVYIGEELGLKRWMWFTGEFGIGIQGRYP
ncbi:MAG: hypothetical protein H6708_21950 [Kofleriaceae bacterium]|nr:hypothetical protein [Myxococcales bacterium]MCB9563079.1 hypothetical protein [Kofleriaceae bacterium]